MVKKTFLNDFLKIILNPSNLETTGHVVYHMSFYLLTACDAANVTFLCLVRSQHFKESIRFIHECRLNGWSCLVHW